MTATTSFTYQTIVKFSFDFLSAAIPPSTSSVFPFGRQVKHLQRESVFKLWTGSIVKFSFDFIAAAFPPSTSFVFPVRHQPKQQQQQLSLTCKLCTGSPLSIDQICNGRKKRKITGKDVISNVSCIFLSNWRRVSKILPWSIRPMNRQPNISSFHSIPGQLFHPSPNQKESGIGQLSSELISFLNSLHCVWIVWLLDCWLFRLPRRFAKFQWGHCTTRERFDLRKSIRLLWWPPLVPMCKIDLTLWRLRSLAYSTATIFYFRARTLKMRMKKEKIQTKRCWRWESSKECTAIFTTGPRVTKTSSLNGFHFIWSTRSLSSFIWKKISPLG